jgi:hypothetical protein
VIAEEYGGFEDSRRRVDLLALDGVGNVQQIIPLPEAKDSRYRSGRGGQHCGTDGEENRDLTRYDSSIGDVTFSRLSK